MKFRTIVAVALAVALAPGVCRADSFPFDGPHLWVGEGSNRTVLVIDWNNGKIGHSKAWGWKWDGPATNLTTILKAIAREDPRLSAWVSNGAVRALAYDEDDDGGVFDVESGTQTDEDDFFSVDGWKVRSGIPSETFLDTSIYPTCLNPDEYCPANGAWVAISWGSRGVTNPRAAETPYGYEVVASDVKSGLYGNVEAALGRPATKNPGWDPFPAAPITPCSPSWESSAIVTLETASRENIGGSITIAFDHPVQDDPANPFGLDFIVFGNAFHTLVDAVPANGTEDPATLRFSSGNLSADNGLVEVSQDGETWFAFSDGPWADGFAPTISHLYDTNAPDTTLFGDYMVTNRWWGGLADATKPVDPTLTAADFQGRTLAEYVRLYNGSAGGTGFDISGFDLPTNAVGRKWIRYVRITTCESGAETEIDAVADVSPAPSFDNWVRSHFTAEDVPNVRAATPCANGRTALECAGLNLAPDAETEGRFAITSFSFDGDRPVFGAGPVPMPDLVWLESAHSPTGGWNRVLPVWRGNTMVLPQGSEGTFYRLKLKHD